MWSSIPQSGLMSSGVKQNIKSFSNLYQHSIYKKKKKKDFGKE